MTLTPTQLMLIELVLANAVKLALTKIKDMSDEELEAAIAVEEAKKEQLVAQLYTH